MRDVSGALNNERIKVAYRHDKDNLKKGTTTFMYDMAHLYKNLPYEIQSGQKQTLLTSIIAAKKNADYAFNKYKKFASNEDVEMIESTETEINERMKIYNKESVLEKLVKIRSCLFSDEKEYVTITNNTSK